MKVWIELSGKELAIRLDCSTCQDGTPSAMLGQEIVCAKCHNNRSGYNWEGIIKVHADLHSNDSHKEK